MDALAACLRNLSPEEVDEGLACFQLFSILMSKALLQKSHTASLLNKFVKIMLTLLQSRME